jgi:hypothetical protein
MMKKMITLLAVAMIALGVGVTNTQAAQILLETFDTGGTAPIAGSTANSGETWVANDNTAFKQDGTVDAAKGAYLPFTLTQGLIYTLEVKWTGTLNHRLFSGFSVGGRGGHAPWYDDGSTGSPNSGEIYAWMYVGGGTGDSSEAYKGNAYLNGIGSFGPWAGDTMTIALDTNPAGYTFTISDASGIRATSSSLGTPAIDHVFYGTDSGITTGKIDNLTLSDDSGPTSTPGTMIFAQ